MKKCTGNAGETMSESSGDWEDMRVDGLGEMIREEKKSDSE
jgi:hypothetical protein